MKNRLLNIVILVFLNSLLYSQVPKSFKYQAIVRNSSGQVIQNQNVSFRINILEGSTTGTSVYEETHSEQTNEFGVVGLNIGEGTVTGGSFNSINWGSGSFFLQTEFDETGGINYQLMGVTQLLSVPYALYSEKSGSSDSSIWKTNANDIYYNQGNVGIGSITPTGKLVVKSDSSATVDDVIFSVLNAQGDTILAVYQEGVRINVYDDPASKATTSKGGFAVGGFSPAKGSLTNEYFRVTPDSVRIYIEESSLVKATSSKGGFAVGGFSPAKLGLTNEYLRVTNDSTRIWTEDTVKGFGVRNIGATTKTSYMQLTPNNYFIGHESGLNIDVLGGGLYNNFFGYQAGKKTSTGARNIFIGFQSGILNNFGSDNVSIGNQSMFKNTSGYSNTANGYQTLYSNTTGYNNSTFGYQTLYNNSIGAYNVAIGNQALFNNLGNYNVASGYQSLYLNTTGTHNTAEGYQAMYKNSTGGSNVAIGNAALYTNSVGNSNVGIGDQSMYYASGYANTAVGRWTLYYNTGDNNSAFGFGAGFSPVATSYANSTALGSSTAISASNQVRIGSNTVTSIGGYAAWTNISDGRFKKDIKETVPGLEFILKLRPVNYHLDMNKLAEYTNIPDSLRSFNSEKVKGEILQTGFIAQEVEESAKSLGFDFSGVDKPKNENDFYGLRYAEFTVPLVKAVQEQQKIIESQQLQIDSLKLQNNNIETYYKKIESDQQQQILEIKAELDNLSSILMQSSKK